MTELRDAVVTVLAEVPLGCVELDRKVANCMRLRLQPAPLFPSGTDEFALVKLGSGLFSGYLKTAASLGSARHPKQAQRAHLLCQAYEFLKLLFSLDLIRCAHARLERRKPLPPMRRT